MPNVATQRPLTWGVLALLLLLSAATPAAGVPATFIGTLEVQLSQLPILEVIRGATAEVSLGPSGELELRIPAGALSGAASIPVTDTSAFPIGGVKGAFANGPATFVETEVGLLAGPMPLPGTLSVCLFGACPAAVATIEAPFTAAGTRGVGIGGGPIGNGGTLIRVTVQGAPWTTGTASVSIPGQPPELRTGFAHGPLSAGLASAAAPGGRIRLVTPIVLNTNIGASPTLPTFAKLTLDFGSIDDGDGDGQFDARDNCPDEPNADQRDFDASGIGDACNDAVDPDGDEIENDTDNCDDISNLAQDDFDGSGIGDACNDGVDADHDEVENDRDNCPDDPNPDQLDRDFDLIGDACNDGSDFDGDEITDDRDNCYALPNPLQEDLDADLLGDPCDPLPNSVNDATRALRMELAQTSGALAQRTAQRDAAVASVMLLTTEVAEKEEMALDLAAEVNALRSALDAAAAERIALEETVTALSRKLGSPPCRADLNDDAVVNFADLAAFKATFLRTCEP